MGEVEERFPLVPLGLGMLPTELVPLHIFEERYKLMIDECIEHEGEFGIVWFADDKLCDVGCAGRITQLLERTDDGRMNILVQGTRPFRLVERIPDLPYPAGTVEVLDDDELGTAEPEAVDGARERYADLVERVTDKRPEPTELAELDAYGMAATIEFAPAPKQELLEQRSEAERLRMVQAMLDETLKKLDVSEQAHELARSNGKLR